MEENRTGTITAVVQINLAEIADGTTSMVRKHKFTSLPTTAHPNKCGTLPKYENTATIPLRSSNLHGNLVGKQGPELSPYDYPIGSKLLNGK